MSSFAIPEIPKSLKSRPRDKRGLPIPFNATIMKDGTPDFRVVAVSKVELAVSKRLCGLSGKKLSRKEGAWFIGGPLSAFSPMGLYLDGPIEPENAAFALMVCPYLALPRFSERNFKQKKGGFDGEIVTSESVLKSLPQIFVAVHVLNWEVIRNGREILFRAERPYEAVSFWQHGKLLTHAQAMELSDMVPDLDTLKFHSKGLYGPQVAAPAL